MDDDSAPSRSTPALRADDDLCPSTMIRCQRTDGSRFLPPEERVRGRCRDVCTRMHPSSSDYESRAVGPHGEGANELARNPPKGGRSDDAATHPGKSAASIPLAPDSFPCQNDTRMAGPSALPPSPYLAIVRRGEGVLFLALDTCLAEPGMDVVWDRRLTERRRSAETLPSDRRTRERRGSAPPSWGWPGLVIVEAPGEAVRSCQAPRERILVVEDDPRVREVLYQALAMAGYDVVVAADGEEALTAYAAAPADLIITDLLMPRKDGVETIRGLRRQHPAAKVIAVTAARGRFNRLTAARHAGAHHTLLKPFGMSDLLAAVRDALAR